MCSWLANSWAWAQHVGRRRNEPISCSRSARAVRSRIVVTVPSTRSPLTTRIVLMTRTRPRRMTTSSRAAVTWSSGSSCLRAAGVLADEHLAQPALDPQVVDRRADRVLWQVEQLAGDLVDERDAVLRVEGDDALGDAVQHRPRGARRARRSRAAPCRGCRLIRRRAATTRPGRRRARCRGRSAGRTTCPAGAPVDGTRSATITVPRWAPTASSDSPSTGTCETRWSTPSSSGCPTSSRPRRPAGRRSAAAALERRVGRHADVEVGLGEAHRRDRGLGDEGLGQGGQPVRVSGSARLARTSGLPATCSARPATRRPSTRSKVAADCASETAATATRTTTMIASWRAKSCPASVQRPPAHDHYELNLLC